LTVKNFYDVSLRIFLIVSNIISNIGLTPDPEIPIVVSAITNPHLGTEKR
jgi:hypothetical protein